MFCTTGRDEREFLARQDRETSLALLDELVRVPSELSRVLLTGARTQLVNLVRSGRLDQITNDALRDFVRDYAFYCFGVGLGLLELREAQAESRQEPMLQAVTRSA